MLVKGRFLFGKCFWSSMGKAMRANGLPPSVLVLLRTDASKAVC
jgi:hypothetical protein